MTLRAQVSRTNAAAVDLIRSFEGFEPRWYKDPIGLQTIGYGIRPDTWIRINGTPVNTSTDVVTEDEAELMLLRSLVSMYEPAVLKAVAGAVLNPNQFGALVSFTYNLGEGAFGSSTLRRLVVEGDMDAAAGQFERWNKAGGKVLGGLTRRREAERALFTTPYV